MEILEDLLDIGEKYDLQELKHMCDLKIKAGFEVSNAVRFLIVSDKYRLVTARNSCIDIAVYQTKSQRCNK